MTEKGPSLLCPGALVHVPGQSGRGPLPFSLLSTPPLVPSKMKMAARIVSTPPLVPSPSRPLGPRWGHVPLTGAGDVNAPPRFRFSRGQSGEVTEKGLSLTSPGAVVHRPGEKGAVGPSHPSRLSPPLAPAKTKVAAECCRSGAEVWTCPPDWDERRNRSPTIFIFEGSDGEGTDAHPLWGARARFWAGRADGPSQGSTHPLAPAKTKVAAERCRSGAEVWTCPPDWDERRNRSPTIFIFEGSDGEGTDAHPLWGARARFWAGRADGPSQGSTHPLAPAKTKVAGEGCRSGTEVWTCPPDRNE